MSRRLSQGANQCAAEDTGGSRGEDAAANPASTAVTDPAATASELRAVCIVLAAWLRAQRLIGHFALVLVLVAAVALLLGQPDAAARLAGGVFVLAPLERMLALRLALDCDLFEAWGRGALNAGSIDTALLRLHLKREVWPSRPFEARIAGTRRLQRAHIAVVLAQVALLCAALWIRGADAALR